MTASTVTTYLFLCAAIVAEASRALTTGETLLRKKGRCLIRFF